MDPVSGRAPALSAATDSTATTPVDLAARVARLAAILQRHERWIVAFSGGVDSTYLLHAALATLGPERVLAVTGVSGSLAARELQEAQDLAQRLGANHRLVGTEELADPRYTANPENRCFFCKNELYDKLASLAATEQWDAIADGTNLDDTGDIRPGRRAAQEHGVVSPLLEAGLRKADIRSLSQAAGLPTWDKPEMPCLSSRIPFGVPVDDAKLRQIEAAEEGLRALGVRGARVRHHGDVARVELPADWLVKLGDADFRDSLAAALHAAGFRHSTVDLEGYRRGGFHRSGTTDIVWRRPAPDATNAES